MDGLAACHCEEDEVRRGIRNRGYNALDCFALLAMTYALKTFYKQ